MSLGNPGLHWTGLLIFQATFEVIKKAMTRLKSSKKKLLFNMPKTDLVSSNCGIVAPLLELMDTLFSKNFLRFFS